MKLTQVGNNTVITEAECINIPLTLDCGQAFRWSGSHSEWFGAAGDKPLRLSQDGNGITLHGVSTAQADFWLDYLDLGTDYVSILSRFEEDDTLREAVHSYYGIRILRQEPWEALCSFIISSNNNIPRIKGIIERLCTVFGRELNGGMYSFPSAQTLASLEPEALAPIRAGFRAGYIIDAARRVASGELDLDAVSKMELMRAREELKTVKGVGDKVADCTLLYGFHRYDSFPVDVWVRRVMEELYPGGLPECTRGYEGIAQQYLFHYIRQISKKEG